MRRRLTLAAATVVAALSLAACGSGNDSQRRANPATGESDVTVAVAGLEFSPETAEIRPGDTVAWVWEDDTTHDVAFENGPASPVQRSGTWQRTFERRGSFDYVCTLHPGMRGTIVVH